MTTQRKAAPVKGSQGSKVARLQWSGAEALDIVHVDHAQIQTAEGLIYLTLGQVRAPILTEQATEVVELRPMGRFVMTPQAAQRVAEVLLASVPNEKRGRAT